MNATGIEEKIADIRLDLFGLDHEARRTGGRLEQVGRQLETLRLQLAGLAQDSTQATLF
jgi:hypothetical protein